MIKFLKLGIILVALLWTSFNISASFTFIGIQNCMQYSKYGLIYNLYNFEITSKDLYNTSLFIISNIELALFLAIRHYHGNFKSLDIRTPRSLSSSIDLTHLSFIWYWNSFPYMHHYTLIYIELHFLSISPSN